MNKNPVSDERRTGPALRPAASDTKEKGTSGGDAPVGPNDGPVINPEDSDRLRKVPLQRGA